jgi:hypothetical protein
MVFEEFNSIINEYYNNGSKNVGVRQVTYFKEIFLMPMLILISTINKKREFADEVPRSFQILLEKMKYHLDFIQMGNENFIREMADKAKPLELSLSKLSDNTKSLRESLAKL